MREKAINKFRIQSVSHKTTATLIGILTPARRVIGLLRPTRRVIGSLGPTSW